MCGTPNLLSRTLFTPGLRALAARHIPGLNAERRVLEEVADPRGLDVRGRRREVGVHRELVVVVWRANVQQFEGDQLAQVREPVRPRRRLVPKAAGVLGA